MGRDVLDGADDSRSLGANSVGVFSSHTSPDGGEGVVGVDVIRKNEGRSVGVQCRLRGFRGFTKDPFRHAREAGGLEGRQFGRNVELSAAIYAVDLKSRASIAAEISFETGVLTSSMLRPPSSV